ncbi:MAG: neutral zinc metallopeptidase [Anaeromyxobacter sp.]|nr:neutral zinc metallopeptidase [Anaeromyxobacter sp.]MBL0276089.1 neutral zinc metallopeptidase [Anaeromyxobacter sp.]
MRLGDDGDRSNVEDRRGARLGGAGAKLGVGGTLVVLVLSLVFKQDLFAVLGGAADDPAAAAGAPVGPATGARAEAEAALEKVAVASFNDAQRTWGEKLGRGPDRYRDARLVLFWDEVRSGCGEAGAEMGPFYCPADQRVYLDLGFYRELGTRFGAPGEFAQAYVIAHEVGHHVQHLLGIDDKVREAQRRRPQDRNALSVRLELQADCLAGVWGHAARARGLLDPGDLESGLGAAAAIGDDRLQQQAGRRVAPESFTHGSSAERTRWFRRGFEGGDPDACDTFAGGAGRP